MAWNLDIQKTLPWGIVMNLGYNGSRSNHLDVKLAPRALPGSPGTDPNNPVTNQPIQFNYDEAAAYYKMNAGTVRVNKRLSTAFRWAPTTSTATPSTTPLRSTAARARWCRTGRIRLPKKGTRSSTFATR